MQIQGASQVTGGVTASKPAEQHKQISGGGSAASSQKMNEQHTVSDPKAVEKATKKIQDYVSSKAGDIQFSTDQSSGKTVVKVVDDATKDVLMQFPPKQALAMANNLDKSSGVLVKDKA
jgi:flagellar protein FlaG